MISRGIWNRRNDEFFDEGLAAFLEEFSVHMTVLDLGCGWQKKYAIRLGADGYDGNPNTLDDDVIDISESFDLGKKYDLVLCLEVMEHIPAEYEQTAIDNICKHAKSCVVLSWAKPGQPGLGHVNCQPEDYVVERMKERGFTPLWEISKRARSKCELPWFCNNVLIFTHLVEGADHQ